MQFHLCKYGHVQPNDQMDFMELQIFYDTMNEYIKEEQDQIKSHK